jgi:hypothetical protein
MLPQVVIKGCCARFTRPHYKEIRQRGILHARNRPTKSRNLQRAVAVYERRD